MDRPGYPGDVPGFADANAPAFFAALKQWLAIPSISADPARHDDVARSARWLADHLRVAGFAEAEIWPTGTRSRPGLPAVSARWPAADPAVPVALVHGHHDVQPVEPLAQWSSPPFEPAEADGQLLGAAAPPVSIKLLIEGEEESGSPNFTALLRSQAARLACDVIVVSELTAAR